MESRAWSGGGRADTNSGVFQLIVCTEDLFAVGGRNYHQSPQRKAAPVARSLAGKPHLEISTPNNLSLQQDHHLDHSLQQLKAIVSGITNINTRSIPAAIESELWCLLCCYGEIILYPGRIVRHKTRLQNILEAILMRVFFWQNMLDMLHWIYCESIDRRGSRFFHIACCHHDFGYMPSIFNQF